MSDERDTLVRELEALQARIIEVQDQIEDEDNGRRYFPGDVIRHIATGKLFLLALIARDNFCFIALADGKYRRDQFHVKNGEQIGVLLSMVVDRDQVEDFELVE